jgi:hypothetical protein
MSLTPKVLEKLISLPNSSGSTRRIERDNSTLSRGTGGAELAKFIRPFWLAASRSPSPLPSPAGRGNQHPVSCLSRASLPLASCASRFNAETPARPSGFDSPLSSARFSLLYVFFHLPCSAESRTGRWGRHTPCRGCGAGAGALVALWNRQHAFVGEPEPLTPCVRNSNR